MHRRNAHKRKETKMSEETEALAALDGRVETQAPANTMAEKLAKVEGGIKLAPSRPETVVAIQLDRGDDTVKKGNRMVAIDREWLATGMAVAIHRGHVIAANCVYGRWSAGVPKVTACHYVVCPQCNRRTLEPLAVWEAKDLARRNGTEIDRSAAASDILAKWGSCPCGGKWQLDKAGEKAELTAFSEKALKAAAEMPEIGEFLPPVAFAVTSAAPATLEPRWQWLGEAMAAAGRGIVPYAKDTPNQGVLVYNPGFWLGAVDDPDATGLFWVEKGKGAKRHASFDPGAVNGL